MTKKFAIIPTKYLYVFGFAAIPYIYLFVFRPYLKKLEQKMDSKITKIDKDDLEKMKQKLEKNKVIFKKETLSSSENIK